MKSAKEILAELDDEREEKGQFMFFLTKSIAEEFKEVCGKRKCSRVVEALIRGFLDDMKRGKR